MAIHLLGMCVHLRDDVLSHGAVTIHDVHDTIGCGLLFRMRHGNVLLQLSCCIVLGLRICHCKGLLITSTTELSSLGKNSFAKLSIMLVHQLLFSGHFVPLLANFAGEISHILLDFVRVCQLHSTLLWRIGILRDCALFLAILRLHTHLLSLCLLLTSSKHLFAAIGLGFLSDLQFVASFIVSGFLLVNILLVFG